MLMSPIFSQPGLGSDLSVYSDEIYMEFWGKNSKWLRNDWEMIDKWLTSSQHWPLQTLSRQNSNANRSKWIRHMGLHHGLSVRPDLQVELAFEHIVIISRVLENRQKVTKIQHIRVYRSPQRPQKKKNRLKWIGIGLIQVYAQGFAHRTRIQDRTLE